MKTNLTQSAPIFLAFLCMGFGDVVSPLTSLLEKHYHLDPLAAGLVTGMGFIMFFFLSVPMALYQDRTSKKRVLVIGLSAAFLGLLLPIAGNYSSFGLILISLLLLGAGATTLQVAGNPIMRDVSPEGKYSRNLSLGQFVKGIGTLSGSLIPLAAARYLGKDWKLLFPAYAMIVLVVIIYTLVVRIKEHQEKKHVATFRSCLKLLFKNRFILLMVLGIFLYVGAEVSLGSKLPNYLQQKFLFDIEKLGLAGTLFFFLAILSGRFLGGLILNWVAPSRFLVISVIVSLAGMLSLFIAPSPLTGFTAIFIAGLGFANIFPLIFSITVDKFPDRSNEISGLMVMAISGGAVIPLIFGAVIKYASLMTGFLVPLLCILYVLLLALKRKNK